MWRNGRNAGEYRECIIERAPENRCLDEPEEVRRHHNTGAKAQDDPILSETERKKDSRRYRQLVSASHRKHRVEKIQTGIGTVICAFFAILFLMPIILTITNSFMSSSEISADYGAVFQTTSTGGKVYIAKTVTLKFIPDIVSFSQYFLTLMIGGGSVRTFAVVMVPYLTSGERNFASVYSLIFLTIMTVVFGILEWMVGHFTKDQEAEYY